MVHHRGLRNADRDVENGRSGRFNDWYLKPSVLNYNCFPQSKGEFAWYRFQALPGTRFMLFQAISKPKVWVAGDEILTTQMDSNHDRFVDVKILKNIFRRNVVS